VEEMPEGEMKAAELGDPMVEISMGYPVSG